jgi:phosphatidylserine/phosphatidylglycerophosphate/cardiolipin synthase-like enzyme
LAFPVNGSSSYYYNKKDPKPQLAHYKENARSVPEFFKLRDVIVQYKNIDELLAPIKIVNKNRQQGTPYVHSKYMIIEGTPNNDMEASLKGGSKFIWVGSSNNDWFGAWNNAEITVIVDNQTSQGNVAINNYEKNFKDLMALGRVFHEKTKIHGSKQGIDMTYDYYNDADYNFGSRDIDNIKA